MKSSVDGSQVPVARRPTPALRRLPVLSRLVLCVLLLAARAAGGFEARKAIAEAPPRELPTLIVTVIDPNDPRLGYMYYRELEAVLGALNNVGFIKTSLPDAGVWSGADGGVRLGTIDLKRWSRSDGGSGGISQHLKLLLVPEAQYGGVDLPALKVALHQSVDGRFYVLGPVLSGSAWSLLTGLKEKAATARSVEIVTGSASAKDLPGILAQLGSPETIRVGATVHSTMELAVGVRKVLCEFCGCTKSAATDADGASSSGASAREIALFLENSTFYGQNFLQNAAKELNALVLPFPAGLADRLEEDPFGAGLAEQDQKPSTDGGRADVNVREARAAFDELLRTLAFEDIRTVAVLATDVRDRLVLLQHVRRLLPGVRVILFESDVLYAQAPDEAMRGTIVASTYPLFPENQVWTSRPDARSRREKMVSDPAEGAYNATLLLLEDMARDLAEEAKVPHARLAEYRAPGFAPDVSAIQALERAAHDSLVEYRSPAFASDISPDAPPIWISVLGARGSWPLAIPELGHPSNFIEHRTQPALTPSWLKRAPTPFRALVLLTVLGAAGLGVWLRRRLAPPTTPASATAPALEAGPTPATAPAESFDWVNLVWLVVLGATTLILALEGLILFPRAIEVTTESVLSVAALILAGLVPILAGLKCIPPHPGRRWVTCALVLLALVVTGLVVMVVGFGRESGRLAPFLVRATHFESGLSPVPPLLLLYLALVVSLFSVIAIREVDPVLSLTAGENKKTLIVVAGAGVVWAWYMLDQFRPMLEIPPLGFIFRVVYALAPLTLVWPFVIALQTAGVLRRALGRIAQEASWDAKNTLAGRHLVLAPMGTDSSEAFRPGQSLPAAFGAGNSFKAGEAFEHCRNTAVAIRRRLVRPLFVTPLLVVGLATYPFEPRGLLLLTYGTLLTAFVLGTVIYVVQTENHLGASMLRAGTKETRALDLGLLMRVTFAMIPALLTLIGAGLPSAGQKIFGWVDQVLTMFK